MMTGKQLEEILDKQVSKPLFDQNYTNLDCVEDVQWEIWNLSLAAHELNVRVRELDEAVKAARWRRHNQGYDPNREHRLSARQLGIEGRVV